MKLKNRISLDYDDVTTMCKHLVYHLETRHVDLIVGVKRGGVVPALHLSHALEKPMEVITWQTRDNDVQEHNQTIKDAILAGKNVVFVDDINDSGLTVRQLRNAYGWDICENPDNVLFATLVEKTTSEETVNVAALRIDDPRWVCFPWEKQST